MNVRWLSSLLCLITIVSTTNSQTIVNSSTKFREHQSGIDSTNTNYASEHLSQAVDDEPELQELPKITTNNDGSNQNPASAIHSRKKRLIWMTDDGRLALPPGTVLSISPTISLPLIRYPYSGFLSNLTMSFPLTIDFDKLGLTDNENPLGVVPPLFARSMGRAAGSFLVSYIRKHLNLRSKRSTVQQKDHDTDNMELPNGHQHAFHGGERALLYGAVEDLLTTFGVNGKACLLRSICEVHSKSLHQYGLFGEIVKLFLTASKSQYAEFMNEYVAAEEVGKGTQSPGECFPYYKDCPKSVFKNFKTNRYSETADAIHVHDASSNNNNTQTDNNYVLQIESQEISDLDNMIS